MKPLWSNKEISLPIAGIESETEMLRVAELLRYILRFHFTFMVGAWGLKMCLPLLSIIQANTPERIYNSTTGELIQFIGASVSSVFSPPLFRGGCFFPHCWILLHWLFNFTTNLHLTSSPPNSTLSHTAGAAHTHAHTRKSNYLIDLQRETK